MPIDLAARQVRSCRVSSRPPVVLLVPVRRHQQGPVHEVKVDVRRRQALAVVLDDALGIGSSTISNGRPSWSRSFSTCFRLPTAAPCSWRRFGSGSTVMTMVRRADEPGQVVDVAVGVVALDAAGQPADVLLAVISPSTACSICRPGHAGVAVLVQQAVGRRQDRAGPVEFDAAALHHDRPAICFRINTGSFSCSATRVGTASSSSYGGYLPPQALNPQSTTATDRPPPRLGLTTNAGPWSRHQLSLVLMWWKTTFASGHPLLGQLPADDPLPVAVGHVDVDRLPRRDLAEDAGQIRRHRVVLVRERDPLRPRPAEPRPGVPLPLGRERIPERGGGLVEDFKFRHCRCLRREPEPGQSNDRNRRCAPCRTRTMRTTFGDSNTRK